MSEEGVAHHYGTFAKEAHAGRFGMWLFLASELMLFAALFTLYTAGRVIHPYGFAEGVSHNLQWLGSLNTLILITSSFTVAWAVHSARHDHRRSAERLLVVTFLLGLTFLAFKTYEYGQHFSEGAGPGGDTRFFAEHDVSGLPLFFSLYYLTTGTHALHVIVGMTILAVLFVKLKRGEPNPRVSHNVELGGLYWHLVDVIWIFLWPMYYLMR